MCGLKAQRHHLACWQPVQLYKGLRAAVAEWCTITQGWMLRTRNTCSLGFHPWAHTALNVNSYWCTSQPKQLSASHTVLPAAGSRTRQCACAFQMHLNTRVSCKGAKLPVHMRSYLLKNAQCFRPARNCWNSESINWCRCKGIEVWILLGKVNTNALNCW